MDHVVYLDAKAHELEKLAAGEKRMLIRGATGRKMPYGRVFAGDLLYFILNTGEGKVIARARARAVENSDKLTPEESAQVIAENQVKLALTDAQIQRWSGKRYLVLIEIEAFETLEPFPIDRSAYGNMDDWLPVEDIERVRLGV